MKWKNPIRVKKLCCAFKRGRQREAEPLVSMAPDIKPPDAFVYCATRSFPSIRTRRCCRNPIWSQAKHRPISSNSNPLWLCRRGLKGGSGGRGRGGWSNEFLITLGISFPGLTAVAVSYKTFCFRASSAGRVFFCKEFEEWSPGWTSVLRICGWYTRKGM